MESSPLHFLQLFGEKGGARGGHYQHEKAFTTTPAHDHFYQSKAERTGEGSSVQFAPGVCVP